MVVFSKPTRVLANKLLNKIGRSDQLFLNSMTPKSGVRSIAFSSLSEVLKFLCNYESFIMEGEEPAEESIINVSYVDLTKLQKWIGHILGDKELSEAIKEELGQGCDYSSYQEVVQFFNKHAVNVKSLIEKRMEQCKQVAHDTG